MKISVKTLKGNHFDLQVAEDELVSYSSGISLGIVCFSIGEKPMLDAGHEYVYVVSRGMVVRTLLVRYFFFGLRGFGSFVVSVWKRAKRRNCKLLDC